MGRRPKYAYVNHDNNDPITEPRLGEYIRLVLIIILMFADDLSSVRSM